MQLLITKIAKVAQKYSSLFSPIAAQTAQTEEFIFQNVTYRPTVHRTGMLGLVHVNNQRFLTSLTLP